MLKEAKAGTLTRTGLSVRLKYVLASSESSFNQIRTGDVVMMAVPNRTSHTSLNPKLVVKVWR